MKHSERVANFVRMVILLTGMNLFALNAHASNSVIGSLNFGFSVENLYEGKIIPRRDVLLRNSWIYQDSLRRRRRMQLPAPDCGSEQLAIGHGYQTLFPESPLARRILGATASWIYHVEMKQFREIYFCALKIRLARVLAEVDKHGYAVQPIPQRVGIVARTLSEMKNWPDAVRSLRYIIGKLIWLSHKAYPPAMFELAKLSFRDDAIRLTPRYTYYLLSVANNAMMSNPTMTRLLNHAYAHLSDTDRAEVTERARKRQWPLTERLVVD